jgi:hypothetical protein
MVVSTPDKALLRVLWDAVLANGRPPQIPLSELARRLQEMHQAGVPVYPAEELTDIQEAMLPDAEALERLGLVYLHHGGAEAGLTRVGELLASTLEYPEWAQTRLQSYQRVQP